MADTSTHKLPKNLTQAWAAVSEWFDEEVPPATLLGVSRLGYDGQLVEVDATILKDPAQQA